MKSIIQIKYMLLLSILLISSVSSNGQSNIKYLLSHELVSFFTGSWSGEGKFSNGEEIKADLKFEVTLDSAWMSQKHTTRPPYQYKATSMWGFDQVSGEFVVYSFDNMKGCRKFSSNGWKDGKLVLASSEHYEGLGLYFERFVFEKISKDRFKFTYEKSQNTLDWVMGDFLVFNRN